MSNYLTIDEALTWVAQDGDLDTARATLLRALQEGGLRANGRSKRHGTRDGIPPEAWEVGDLEWFHGDLHVNPDTDHVYFDVWLWKHQVEKLWPRPKAARRGAAVRLACAEWIREQARSGADYRGRKDVAFRNAQEKTPDLVRDIFDKMWQKHAPEEWKRPGRPTKKSPQ